MDAQDMRIIDSYENLINDYSPERSCAFLQACWLLDDRASLQSSSLARMIFSEGDSQEIYTLKERDFVGSFVPEVDYECFQMVFDRSIINCRVISVELAFSSDVIYDSIKFMKIFNKAFKGFNVFSFCCADGIHLGCSCIKSRENERDCIISPLITPSINWEQMTNILLYRDEPTSLYAYYLGMFNTISEIQNCFVNSEDELSTDAFLSCFDDDDPIDRLGRIRLSEHTEYVANKQSDQEDTLFDATLFEFSVEECFAELVYIKTLRANPLEMLFEAEAALEQINSASLQNMQHSGFPALASVEIDDENIELLNDPATLVKKLKTELVIK